MINIDKEELVLTGPKGEIPLKVDDEITKKLSMLFEGECEGIGAGVAAAKFGFTRQRYYQLLRQFQNQGAEALKSKKTGPQNNYRRSDEVVRQIIRHRFLDPDATLPVIAQKLNQCGFCVSIRSVERVISQYGLQKKTLSLPSSKGKPKN